MSEAMLTALALRERKERRDGGDESEPFESLVLGERIDTRLKLMSNGGGATVRWTSDVGRERGGWVSPLAIYNIYCIQYMSSNILHE
jgi:hypothetical protein